MKQFTSKLKVSASVSSTIDYPFPPVKTLHSAQLTSFLKDADYPKRENLEWDKSGRSDKRGLSIGLTLSFSLYQAL